MPSLGGCCWCGAYVAVFLAVVANFVAHGGLRSLGLASTLELFEVNGDQVLVGLSPALYGPDARWEVSAIPSLEGQVVLVTGANVGLGYWSALQLARKGAKVLLGCRTPTKCDIAAATIRHNLTDAPVRTGSVQCLEIDLSSVASVSKAAAVVLKEKRLDQLMLNAGMVAASYKESKDGIEMQWHSNVVGHQQLYTLLSPLLEKTATAQGHATVTALSSTAHFDARHMHFALETVNNRATYDTMARYSETKAANVLFVHEAVRRLPKGSKVLINSVHPGSVASEFGRSFQDLFETVVGSAVAPYATSAFIGLIKPLSWTSEEGALTQLWASASRDISTKRITGKYFHPIARETRVCARLCNDPETAKSVWTFIEQLIASKSAK